MSDKDPHVVFAQMMTIYFVLSILAVPLGLGLGQLIKYFTGQ